MALSIMDLFGRSPFGPLQEHMSTVCACAEMLHDFFSACTSSKDTDWSDIEQIQNEIVALENKADDLKNDIRIHLPKGLFLPVPRQDFLELLRTQDSIANRAKDIAGLVVSRKMLIPEAIKKSFTAYLDRNLDAIKQAKKATRELHELFEAGFRGAEVKIIGEMIVSLHNIEHDTDTMQRDIRHDLFLLEASLSSVDVMFLYKIVEWTGGLADNAEDVGDRIHLLMAK